MDEKEKNTYVDKILEKSIDLIINILNNNIYKLDYLITWSKYYYDIIEEENNFKLIRNYIYEIFQKLLKDLKEIYQPNITGNKVQRTTLYFYNIIFEYYTYYKINANLNRNDTKDEEILYQEISAPFKYKILTELKKEVKEKFPDDIYDIIQKLPFYTFMDKAFIFFRPIWYDDKKKKMIKFIKHIYITNKIYLLMIWNFYFIHFLMLMNYKRMMKVFIYMGIKVLPYYIFYFINLQFFLHLLMIKKFLSN